MPRFHRSPAPRVRLLPLALAVSMLFVACTGEAPSPKPPETPVAEPASPEVPTSQQPSPPPVQAAPGQPPPATSPDTPAEQPPQGHALASYCDPSAAIAAYPRFGAQVPEVVAHMHPSGGRDYPVIDAHTHLATSASQEAELQHRVGLYAAVDAAWDVTSTARLRATYKKPNLIQFNLGGYFNGLEAQKLPSIQSALDGQRAAGAGGIKIFKDMGLAYNDSSGARLRVDDPRLYPLWQRAADEKWAVSIHVADPDSWMKRYYADSPYSKQELIRQFIRVVEDNPRTIFVAIHLLNLVDSDAELDQLGQYLDRYPNLYADTAARSQYLVNLTQPHVRDFMIQHQDKLLFGTDRAGENSPDNYEQELRYWETTGPTRTFYLNQQAQGLGLPSEVLEEVLLQERASGLLLPVPRGPLRLRAYSGGSGSERGPAGPPPTRRRSASPSSWTPRASPLRVHPRRSAQSVSPGRSRTVMMVASIVATSFSSPSSSTPTTFPWQTESVRPAFSTWPRAMNRRPEAGASRLILNSVLSTAASGGMRLSAA